MQVFIGARQTGKTYSALDWLLEGESRKEYPYWSRVIVCATNEQTLYVTRQLHIKTAGTRWEEHPRIIDIRKAVWGVNDLKTGLRHNAKVEIMVDDADIVLQQLLRVSVAAMTLTTTDPTFLRSRV